jgi:hypothetical protein
LAAIFFDPGVSASNEVAPLKNIDKSKRRQSPKRILGGVDNLISVFTRLYSPFFKGLLIKDRFEHFRQK